MEKWVKMLAIAVLIAEVVFAVVLIIRAKRMGKENKIEKTAKEGNKLNNNEVQAQERAEAGASILKGLENNEFKMYLQFVVDNKTKNIVSAEALSRWENKEKGIVGPGNYIGHMERTGLISQHDFYMFELACRQLEKWSNTQYKDIAISCNFTRITLSEESFIDSITKILDSYKFDRTKLSIEITEDAIEIVTENLKKCKEL